MFRELIRKKQLLPEEESIRILRESDTGILGLIGDEGYPYTVPVNYYYEDGVIWIHGAKRGHKVDAVRNCDKASFCVIDADKVIPETYSTDYRSVICFGKITIEEDEDAKYRACDALAEKYRPGYLEERKAEMDLEFPAVCVFRFEIEHMTGKESKNLMNQRNNNS